MSSPAVAQSYCALSTDYCRTMAEWGVYWQALGVFAAVLFGVIGLYKIYQELLRLNEQREKEHQDKETNARLKRTEFFLNQHRRLFDDPVLYSVLQLIDSDGEQLAKNEMFNPKRKFLTFIEEIALLVNSDQINKKVALYMFGHYARCAHRPNFEIGLNMAKEHWALFYSFVDDAVQFKKDYPDGPPKLEL